MTKVRVQFCVECRKETSYQIRTIPFVKRIRDKEYEFEILEAVCEACGEPINIAGLMDYNVKEIDRQYRIEEHLVTVQDIQNLMELYKIGKAPLSLALGFGEITITRYLAGQVPSKEYSDIIREALENPAFMKKKLQENRDKIGDIAYKKAMTAANELKPLFLLSEKMLLSISYIFDKTEVTPLALQKLLYFIQGIYMVLYGKPLLDEDCFAWTHGPVYKDVYEVFKNFRYNPIDDTRFALFKDRFNELADEEKKVIDLVLASFGMYSGKILEKITHMESPWKEAHINSLPNVYSNEVITKEAIDEYFTRVSKEYKLDDVSEINKYISHCLQIENVLGDE